VLPEVTLLPLGPPPTPEKPPPGILSPFFVRLQEESRQTTSSGETNDLVGDGDDGACDNVVGLTVVGEVGLSVVVTAVVEGDSVEPVEGVTPGAGVVVPPGGAGVVAVPGGAEVVVTPGGEGVVPGTDVVAGEAVVGLGWGVLAPVGGEAVAVPPGAGVAAGVGLVVALVEGVGVGPAGLGAGVEPPVVAGE
jgi:hypothetical protein